MPWKNSTWRLCRWAYNSCTNILYFNASVKYGIIPAQCKQAAIVPVFKGLDRSKPGNYRPISLTSVIMKSVERIIRKQVSCFLENHKMLNDKCVDIVYLDYAKAFAKVDHKYYCIK